MSDDGLARHLRPRADLDGGRDGGARRDADRDALDPGAAAGHGRSRPRWRRVTTSSMTGGRGSAGTKPAPMPWILCGPGCAAGQHRAVLGLDRDHPDRRLARLQHLADAGDGAAGADAGDDDVDLAVGVVPDLLGGGAAVDLRVGRVLELLRDDRVGDLRRAAPRRGRWRRACPSAPGVSSSSAPSSCSILRRSIDMRLGHDQDQPVALGGGDEGERDAGVAGGRLDQRGRRRA